MMRKWLHDVLGPFRCVMAILWRIAGDDALATPQLALFAAPLAAMGTDTSGNRARSRRFRRHAHSEPLDLQIIRSDCRSNCGRHAITGVDGRIQFRRKRSG